MTRLLTFLLMAGLAFPALLDAAQTGKGTNDMASIVMKSGATITLNSVEISDWPSGGGGTNIFSVGTDGLVPGPATTGDGLLNADGTWMGKTNITIAMTNFYNLLLRATPIGAIQMYSGLSAPAGWKKCDGASYTTNAEPNLFAVVGYTYGGSAANFNVPNLVQRFPYGGTNNLGTTGGASTVTLVSNNIPAHLHGVDPPATASGTESAAHTHGFTVAGNGWVANTASGGDNALSAFNTTDWDTDTESATHTHTTDIAAFDSGSSGSGTAFTNLPPYIVVNYIIFAGE